ncbi:MAG: nucleotide-binding domain-containing protein [Vogesella sp.]|uniref:nucleotide-binding domain-containing protein n=1 Tax=Vogesella sp. TaxID=1904252 RepID=UPI003F3D7A0B
MRSDVNEFTESFSSLYKNSDSKRSIIKSATALDSASTTYVAEAAAQYPALHEEFTVQRPIRSWFGKDTPANKGTIGPHPDFAYLAGTDEIEMHHITTIFVDIKNSTRLSLKYDLDTVRHIKNTILRVASETVRALDGHVHRFMGDALMAYFGGKGQDKETAAMAAISCSAMLRLLMEKSVVPGLRRHSIDPLDIGFRVGIDFGDDADVLWSSYGYSNVNEVTATSFYVDASAKLQSMAAKDNTMLGYSLKNLLGLTDYLVERKAEQKNGETNEIKYLRPNYEMDAGRINYEVFQLNFKNFSRLLPIPIDLKQEFCNGIKSKDGISFQAFLHGGNEDQIIYPSMSRCIPKKKTINFILKISPQAFLSLRTPLRMRIIKQNYGEEAQENKAIEPEIFTVEIPIKYKANGIVEEYTYKFGRDTAYRGVHTVTVSIVDNVGTAIFSESIGVHIK